uniref:Malonyl-[acyl-carrier protein] O-methyltransferase n=1 Tax=Candidatus Aschnera chinzeii TaxID=1485666 RepID=A0AAT9G4S1_9ENTR|nr:MAG: malonyl-ACP O-methyltransferase BioC [Candidatus Aschnera chinzeii]
MNSLNKKLINKRVIAKSFGRAAKNYDKIAFFQQKSGKILFDSVSTIQSSDIILDAGCGTGYFSKQWKLIGKKVIALDLSLSMLYVAKEKKTAMSYIHADIELLPLKDETIDLCFSHLAIQWCENLYTALSELYRITKKGGIVAFSTILDGSLEELKQCLHKIDEYHHVNSFLTFKEIQSICNNWSCNFKQQTWHLIYPTFHKLLQSLKGIGATYLWNNRKHYGLMTKNYLNKLINNYPCINDEFPLTYKLVFGILYRE